MISEDTSRTSRMSTEQLRDEHPSILGTSNNLGKHVKLKYHRVVEVDLTRVTRRMKGEGRGNYPHPH